MREKILNKTIETPHVHSDEQLTNVFTKSPSKGALQNMVSKLTSEDGFASAWRGNVGTMRMSDHPNPPKIGDSAWLCNSCIYQINDYNPLYCPLLKENESSFKSAASPSSLLDMAF